MKNKTKDSEVNEVKLLKDRIAVLELAFANLQNKITLSKDAASDGKPNSYLTKAQLVEGKLYAAMTNGKEVRRRFRIRSGALESNGTGEWSDCEYTPDDAQFWEVEK